MKSTTASGAHLHTTLLFCIMLCLVLYTHPAHGAPASESYILDSISIGRMGTTNATSTSYQTDSFSSLFFFQGEEVAISEDSENTRGVSGSRITIQPANTRSHIYTEIPPLVLTNGQSGTLFRAFRESTPSTYATLYISLYATAKSTDPEGRTTYTLERREISNEEQGSLSAFTIFSNTLYTVTASTEKDSILILRKFLTLIIQDSALREAEKDSYAVFYLHPTFNVWAKIPHPAFIDGAAIFQTPYVTRYFIAQNKEGIPEFIKTAYTPENISEEEIKKSIDAEIENLTQIEEQERGIAYPSVDPSPTPYNNSTKPDTPITTVQKTLSLWYAQHRTLFFLLLPFLLLAIALIPIMHKRKSSH